VSADRRKFLKYIGAVGVAAAAGVVGYEALLNTPGTPTTSKRTNSTTTLPPTTTTTTPTSSISGADWTPDYSEFLKWLQGVSKPYRGKTLNLSLESEPFYLGVQSRDPDFYLASGINNSYNIQPYSLQLSTVSLMVNTSAPTYDAFTVDHQDVAEFKDYILSPTDLAEKYPDLTYENLNPQDFYGLPWSVMAVYPPDKSYNYGGSSPGTVHFIPGNSPVTVQFYRNDLYQAQGLTPAKTWDDYFNNVKATNQTHPTIRYGCVDMASFSVSVVQEFLNHLKSFGGDLWSINGNQLTSLIDSDASLAALQNMVRLEPYSDTGSAFYTQDNLTSDMAFGVASNCLQFGDYAYYQDDKFRSSVVGLVDYAPVPAGPKGSFSTWSGGGLGVSKFSPNPQAAWLWLQWATSLGLQEMIALGPYHSFPSRKTVISNSLVQQAIGTTAARSLQVVEQVWNANQAVTLTTFPQWWNSLQYISYYLNNAWQGINTPQQALTGAAQRVAGLGPLTF